MKMHFKCDNELGMGLSFACDNVICCFFSSTHFHDHFNWILIQPLHVIFLLGVVELEFLIKRNVG